MQCTLSIRLSFPQEFPAVLTLWERSVRATHHFLAEADILFYKPLVRDILPAAELWVAEGARGDLAGFMILDENKVEALFLDPDCFGRGLGRAMLRHAHTLKGPLSVDVNEANQGARAFYKRCGFTQTGRSPLDGTGRPFPLIHLRQRPVADKF